MKILVTGGMGYIGSHTCVELIRAGHDVVVVDNLSNAQAAVQQRVEQIAGKAIDFVNVDVRDRAGLENNFIQRTRGRRWPPRRKPHRRD